MVYAMVYPRIFHLAVATDASLYLTFALTMGNENEYKVEISLYKPSIREIYLIDFVIVE